MRLSFSKSVLASALLTSCFATDGGLRGAQGRRLGEKMNDETLAAFFNGNVNPAANADEPNRELDDAADAPPVNPQLTPGLVPMITPQATGGSTPQLMPQPPSVPGQVPQITPQATGGSTPQLMVQPPNVPGQVPPLTPPVIGGSTPQLMVQPPNVPGQVPPLTPPIVGGSTPQLMVQPPNVPGQVPPLTPPIVGGSTPQLMAQPPNVPGQVPMRIPPQLATKATPPLKKGNPVTGGDPHFTMFNGHKFDFHGGCDLVLLDEPEFNNGQGLTIHIRTKISTWWSYISNAVVKIGDDTFEVKSGLADKQYWTNGEAGEKLIDSGRISFQIGGFPIRFRVRRKNEFQFKIFLDDGQSILIRSVKDLLRVEIEDPIEETFSKATGLMGKAGSNASMLARDGVTVFNTADDYGKEWQVLASEPMLFHNVEGTQHPQTCAMPSEQQSTEQRRRLVEGSISRVAAEDICRRSAAADEVADCVFDVLATGDFDVASAY